jgi:hypothetical protein
VVAATAANHRKVVRVEGVMPEAVGFVDREGQQLVTLGRVSSSRPGMMPSRKNLRQMSTGRYAQHITFLY